VPLKLCRWNCAVGIKDEGIQNLKDVDEGIQNLKDVDEGKKI